MNEIIVVTNHLTFGGTERVLSELMNEWISCGNKVTVLQVKTGYVEESPAIPDEVEVIEINTPTYNRLLRRFIQCFRIIRQLNSRKNASVLAMSNPTVLLVGLCSPFIKNKIVFSERNDPERSPNKKSQRFVRDFMYRLADACVFQTEYARKHFCRSVQNKGVVISNPISRDLPEPYSGKRRKAIVSVCRLSKQKNLPMTICAFAKLSREYPEYVLEIYGEGEQEEELRELIKSLELEDRIFLMSYEEHIYEKIQDASIFVSSSDYEGVSNSMLEALGMGIPTICTDCPGAVATIENGEKGLLVPVGDIDALCQAMKKILESPDLSRLLSRNAYKICEEHQVTIIAQKWLEVLRSQHDSQKR